MANGDDSFIHLFHTVWSGVLTVFGGLIVWNWKRLVDQVDGKVDKTEVETLRKELRDRWVAQDSMHQENRTRLDAIYQLLARKRGRA
jgi:hypothetical protein